MHGTKQQEKNMVLLDANAVLRYILNDHIDMASEVSELISSGKVIVPIFVLAEVIYVLNGVYKVDKSELKESILSFLSEVNVDDREVIELGIRTFSEKNLDFVDCILYAYSYFKRYDIFTFDKKLNKLLDTI